jgi:hypothetical protein
MVCYPEEYAEEEEERFTTKRREEGCRNLKENRENWENEEEVGMNERRGASLFIQIWTVQMTCFLSHLTTGKDWREDIFLPKSRIYVRFMQAAEFYGAQSPLIAHIYIHPIILYIYIPHYYYSQVL